MSLFRRKDVASLQAAIAARSQPQAGPRRGNLVLLGIGAIIGAGIFVLTGQAAANYAGPAIVFSFILAGAACGFAGLCYAEFAAMIPISGSAYTYGYATLGEFVAWIIGWDLILEYLFAAQHRRGGVGRATSSRCSRTWGSTFPRNTPGRPIPTPWRRDVPWWNVWSLFTHGWIETGNVINVPAMFIVFAHHGPAGDRHHGIGQLQQRHRRHQDDVVILAFIAFGMAYINRENWVPFIPPATGPGHFGIGGIARGAAVIFFAYIGFDAVSTAAQETKNPSR